MCNGILSTGQIYIHLYNTDLLNYADELELDWARANMDQAWAA